MNPYQAGLRRMLVDMHIPAWEPEFLASYDPRKMAELYERANLTSVMLYCKSHVGLCNWPTEVGAMHPNLGGRDVVGELVEELRSRGIATCAYTSVVFENWAVETHPDWRMRRADGFDAQDLLRYGFACQNHPEYVAYEHALVEELLTSYPFDAVFYDMAFWPLPCACDHCRDRYRVETGLEQPDRVDWLTPDWPRWQAAREGWADDFVAQLAALARRVAPGIAVTHNLAPALADFVFAQPLAASRHDDFVAGDLYGDRYEQLAVSKLSLHLSETRPAEFMTSRCVNLSDHVRLKREDEMRLQAMAATAMSSAFLFIDAIDPAGTANDGVFERIGRIFAETEPYEPFLGGTPLEDIAIYFSVDSQMDLGANDFPLSEMGIAATSYPHGRAVQGMARILQRAHRPFGVITRKQLGELHRWRLLVLPDIQRMDDEEIAAVRQYVADGGLVYASRFTSVVDTAGARREDFGLADVFGCHLLGEEDGHLMYVRPVDDDLRKAVDPQQHISVRVDPRPLAGQPLLEVGTGDVLAARSLPYGHPGHGSVVDRKWSSIHSSPPWEDTAHPTVVFQRFGAGASAYCVAPVEVSRSEADDALVDHLLDRLLGDEVPAWGADTHPSVWVNVVDQPDRSRLVASLLNYQHDLPPAPVAATLRLRPPSGRAFVGLSLAPDLEPLPFALEADGTLVAELPPVSELTMVVASYR